ncbi:MAG: UDP-N-acetylmuramate--L-alanine ligase [Marmoricola sp.]
MKIAVPENIDAPEELGRVHFVGIGGAGLSAIARIMAARGVPVSGCDGQESPVLDSLRALGIECHVGHDASHVFHAGQQRADTLVVSTAVAETNPDVVAAGQHAITLLPRSAAVQSMLLNRKAIAIAGTHGKTTTTSLLTVALRHCGADPSFAIGGELASTGTNAHDGVDELFVAEADESDGAFLVYTPFGAIVTNVESDHLDNYGTDEAYHEAFETFLGRIANFVVLCTDDPGAAELLAPARGLGLKAISVGEREGADLQATNLRFVGRTSTFEVRRGLEPLGSVTLQIPGRHYVLDATAALAAGLELGFAFEDLAAGLGSFTGTRRRMEFKGEHAGVRVYDSYAHHPTEIAGDLQAARALVGDGRLIVAFQPHMVSRTRIFGSAMGVALGAADVVVVMDIYLAREQADPDVTAHLIADAVPHDQVVVEPDFDRVAHRLVDQAQPGDVVLTLGAGTVTHVGPQVLALLEGRS